MEKYCANYFLPFECAAPSRECWCLQVPAWQPVQTKATEQSAGFLCKTCLSLLKLWSPEQLHTI